MVPVIVVLVMVDVAAGNAPVHAERFRSIDLLRVWVSAYYTRQIKESRTYAIVHHPFIARPRRISSSASRSMRVSCAGVEDGESKRVR